MIKNSESLPTLDVLSSEILYKKLDGSEGCNREKNQYTQITARNDFEAIQCWLNEYKHKATTLRSYQKEAERFLLWCIIKQKKALSSINREDIEYYCQFLNNPEPRDIWCSTKIGRGCLRGSAQWKPFRGILSDSAKITAISVIESLFSYLVDARYLAFNPFSLIKRRTFLKKTHSEMTLKLHERILQQDEWYAILDTLENLPEVDLHTKQEKYRLKLILALLFFLGLRINELITHEWNAFRKIEEKWWFFVIGKGDKLAKIPVNNELLKIIILYRATFNKTPLPTADEKSPLIISINKRHAISARYINKLLKKLAEDAAKRFINHPDKVQKLKKFSAHWLRHLSASMQDSSGISFKHIRANLRHENDETTRRYVHAIDDARHDEMQKLKLRTSNT